MFDQGGAAFDPIAAIHVADTMHLALFCMMDMATNHAIQAAPLCLSCKRLLEIINRLHGALHL